MAFAPDFLQFPQRAIRQTSRLRQGMTFAVNPRASTGRLAVISHGKLQQESSSYAPDLRRCIGHHGILQQCVRESQEQTDQHLRAFGGGATAESDSDVGIGSTSGASNTPPIRSQIIKAVKAMAQNLYTSAPRNQREKPPPRQVDGVSQKPSLAIRTRQHASRIFPGRTQRTQ